MAIRYSRTEDRWNAWTHALGIVIVAVSCLLMSWRCACDSQWWSVAAVLLYMLGAGSSYVTSAVYHSLPPGTRARDRARHLDHTAIYWHIAGSYCPITLIVLRQDGFYGWALFAFMGVAAAVGTWASLFRLKEHSNLETICFVLMGGSIFAVFGRFMDHVSLAAVVWIILHGVSFITGAVFYSLRRPYTHTIFHFFVLGGTLCYLAALWEIIKL